MGTSEVVGDNKEFGIGTAGAEVTIHFYNASGNTSGDDTATDVYFDTSRRRKKIQIRNSQAITVLEINNTIYTDPESISANKGLIERFDTPIVTKMKIKTTTANTNIKVRAI